MRIRDIKPFGLRLPPPVKEEVAKEAARHRRSLNCEMTLLIEEALAARKGKAEPAPPV